MEFISGLESASFCDKLNNLVCILFRMYSSNDLVMNVFILSGYPNGKIKNVIGHNVMNTNTLQSKFPKLKSWAKKDFQ